MKNLISSEYLKLLKRMHAAGPWGTKGHKYFDEIISFVDRIGACSILDYGCGQATFGDMFREKRPEITVYNYDPAIDDRQGFVKVDVVVCTDVLEHVEEEYLNPVIDHIASLANRGIYLIVALKKAKRFLPDGRNAHLIVQNSDWWKDRLRERLSKQWILEFGKQKSLRVMAVRK